MRTDSITRKRAQRLSQAASSNQTLRELWTLPICDGWRLVLFAPRGFPICACPTSVVLAAILSENQ